MWRAWSWLRRRDGLRQILIVVGGFEVYEGLRHLMKPNWPVAFDNAARIEDLERWGHFAWEQSLQRVFLGVPDLVQAMNIFYFVGHFVFTGIFFTWLYFRSRDGFRSLRNAFLIATAISLFIHWQFPTAPPRLAGVGLTDTLRSFSGIDIGSPHSSPFSNPVAAVPSLHAGFALGVAYGVVKYARPAWMKVLGVVYPLLVVLTIVVTGNHFIVDAIAGMLVMVIGLMASARLQGRKDRAILRPATRGGAVR
ncbi:MAG TPA: phosphatase PAP2 family protein [Gaiellaceae bacterium]